MTQTTQTTPPSTTEPAREARPAGIAGLSRMSTTAGVGLQEYRALSPLAVAAVVCGAAGWLAVLHPLLLLVPLAAVVLGGLAVAQIVRAAGTRGGLALAVVGLALGLGFLGYILVTTTLRRGGDAAYRAEIKQLAETFGSDLVAGDYRAAYDLTSDGFQGEFPFPVFRSTMAGLPQIRDENGAQSYGDYTGARSNDLAEVTRDPATGRVGAEAMLIVGTSASEPIRQPVLLTRTPGGWRIVEFGVWFPRDPRRLRDSGEGPAAGR